MPAHSSNWTSCTPQTNPIQKDRFQSLTKRGHASVLLNAEMGTWGITCVFPGRFRVQEALSELRSATKTLFGPDCELIGVLSVHEFVDSVFRFSRLESQRKQSGVSRGLGASRDRTSAHTPRHEHDGPRLPRLNGHLILSPRSSLARAWSRRVQSSPSPAPREGHMCRLLATAGDSRPALCSAPPKCHM